MQANRLTGVHVTPTVLFDVSVLDLLIGIHVTQKEVVGHRRKLHLE